MCVFPARVKLRVLVTAVFLVCVVAVQVGVLSGLCPDTCDLGGLCYNRSYAWGVLCV